MHGPFGHVPVLVKEVVTLLDPGQGSVILDGTVGLGGHAEVLLAHAGSTARLIGLDRDMQALQHAAERLKRFGNCVTLHHASYADAAHILQETGNVAPTHILLDLGMSSLQLEESGRGFSFHNENEPLDMRFDSLSGCSAAELLRYASQEELAGILRKYGEERAAGKIAHAIILARKEHPLLTVGDLTSVVASIVHRTPHSHLHPATRTFQALRIAVNDELGTLERALPQLLSLLSPHGRMAVVSFHSLEDRIVKTFFKREATDCICPPSFPVCRCDHVASLRILTKHAVTASDDEQRDNPRSRSAKLRVIEKLSTNNANIPTASPKK